MSQITTMSTTAPATLPLTVPQQRRAPQPAAPVREGRPSVRSRRILRVEPLGTSPDTTVASEATAASGLRALVARLLGQRPITAQDRAHAAAARRSHRSERTEALAAHAHLMRTMH